MHILQINDIDAIAVCRTAAVIDNHILTLVGSHPANSIKTDFAIHTVDHATTDAVIFFLDRLESTTWPVKIIRSAIQGRFIWNIAYRFNIKES